MCIIKLLISNIGRDQRVFAIHLIYVSPEKTMPITKLMCQECGKKPAADAHIFDEWKEDANKWKKHNDYLTKYPERGIWVDKWCHYDKYDGAEPKYSTLKEMVRRRECDNKVLNMKRNHIRARVNMEFKIPKEWIVEANTLKDRIKETTEQVEKFMLKTYPNEVDTALKLIGKPATIYGLAKIVSEIDWEKTNGVAKLWSYVGYNPEMKKEKGKAYPVNHRIKPYCFQIIDSWCIKHKNPFLRNIFDPYKERKMKEGVRRGYAHNMAIRKTAKELL